MGVIYSFLQGYACFDNAYEVPVNYLGVTYGSAEAAYQAQKCRDIKDRLLFAGMSPDKAHEEGQRVQICENWDNIRYGTMYGILYAKFTQNPDIAEILISTQDDFLDAGPDYGNVWGTERGVGKNWLGELLMSIREILINKKVATGLAVLVRHRLYDIATTTKITLEEVHGLTQHDLVDMTKLIILQEVTFYNTRIPSDCNLNCLKELKNLKKLTLYNGGFSDLTQLSELTQLEELRLNHNPIMSIQPLTTLTRLKKLSLSETPLTNFGPLAALKSLEELTLSDTKITDISILRSLTNLKSLNLYGTNVRDFSPLKALKNLEYLGTEKKPDHILCGDELQAFITFS